MAADGREHRFRVAGRLLPAAAPQVPGAMLRLLDRLGTTPARIITDLRETLVQRLTAAIDSGGTASAIGVCVTDAGALTDSIARELGMSSAAVDRAFRCSWSVA